MNCQILFPEKKRKKNITNLSSAEIDQRVVKVKMFKISPSYPTVFWLIWAQLFKASLV